MAPLLEVGRIGKAHGLRGEVVVTLLTDRTERVQPKTVMHCDERMLEVVKSRPHQGKFIVLFAGVNNRNDAEELRGKILTAEPLDDPDVLWIHELIGRTVVDTHGVLLGTVSEVEANPASDLLVLEDGGLIPLTFLRDHEGEHLVVDPPEGLLEPDGHTAGDPDDAD